MADRIWPGEGYEEMDAGEGEWTGRWGLLGRISEVSFKEVKLVEGGGRGHVSLKKRRGELGGDRGGKDGDVRLGAGTRGHVPGH